MWNTRMSDSWEILSSTCGIVVDRKLSWKIILPVKETIFFEMLRFSFMFLMLNPVSWRKTCTTIRAVLRPFCKIHLKPKFSAWSTKWILFRKINEIWYVSVNQLAKIHSYWNYFLNDPYRYFMNGKKTFSVSPNPWNAHVLEHQFGMRLCTRYFCLMLCWKCKLLIVMVHSPRHGHPLFTCSFQMWRNWNAACRILPTLLMLMRCCYSSVLRFW